MTNEYGQKLDRNGYAPSIVEQKGTCLLCGRTLPLQRHEAFHGANRKKAKALGCWCLLCRECHYKVHHVDHDLDLFLKRIFQTLAMEHYGWTVEQFIKEWGKNWVEVE